MLINRKEETAIPQTIEGRNFADEYEKQLRDRGAFRDRKESTTFIIIYAEYYFRIEEV